MNFAHICEEVSRTAEEIMGACLTQPGAKRPTLLEREQLLVWTEDTFLCEEQIKYCIHAALTSARYVEIVCAAYNSAFDSNPQLKRLETFQGMLTKGHGMLRGRVTDALLRAKPDVGVLENNTMEQLLYSTDTDIAILTALCIRVSRCITKHVMMWVNVAPILVLDSFQFTEDAWTAETRAELMQKLENFDRAAFRINNIEREFVADNYEDKVLQSLLNAAEAFNPRSASPTQVLLPQPAQLSTATAALYDDLDLHSSESPASRPTAQTQAEQEGNPGSPVASDFSFIE